MILRRLTLCDFRAFRGTHTLHLTPSPCGRRLRPIILIGGLNGVGKTTLMLATKLALYGRHAIGMGTSNKAYNQFVRENFNQASASLVHNPSNFVEIEFEYGKLGERSIYTVKRSWKVSGRRVQEQLLVFQDEKLLTLSPEASQGFLNELLPIGVYELFFFDGEKIAELAEDETGRVLGDAVHQLIGLHLIDRLRNDLRVFILRQSHQDNGRESNELNLMQSDFLELLQSIESARTRLACAHNGLKELTEDYDKLDLRLKERGGDWSVSRKVWLERVEEISEALKNMEGELREELAGIYPLSLAIEPLTAAIGDASQSLLSQTRTEANRLLEQFATSLKLQLDSNASRKIDKLLGKTKLPEIQIEKSIDVSHRALGRMEQVAKTSIPEARARVERLVQYIDDTQIELDKTILSFEQAPDEATLTADIEKLSALQDEIRNSRFNIAAQEGDIQTLYKKAIEKARTLRNRHEVLFEHEERKQPLEFAMRVRQLLNEFRFKKAKRKIDELEHEFKRSFQDLARKDDLVANAQINPHTFMVTLFNHEGLELRRAQLSAGEKQIYAFALLNALERTSGHRLPLLIDTPLGRLDSHHRSSLVSNFFPRASHQVILLSTDMEIDVDFYNELSPHVSHAYDIRYSRKDKTSRLYEGYSAGLRNEPAR